MVHLNVCVYSDWQIYFYAVLEVIPLTSFLLTVMLYNYLCMIPKAAKLPPQSIEGLFYVVCKKV